MESAGGVFLVVHESDPMRQEALTHDLQHALAAIDGLRVTVADVDDSPAGHQGPAAKGGVDGAALWLAVAATARATTPVLLAAIEAWCEHHRNRRVRIESGGTTVEITGMDDPALRAQATALLAAQAERSRMVDG